MTPVARAKKPSKNRDLLINVARRLFGAKGFAATGTEEIVATAGLTRGALYYQFGDKRDLFRAVFLKVIEEVGHKVWRETMERVTDDKEDLIVGTRIMLDEFSRGEIKQIVLADGPVVLGWSDWREMQRPLHLAMLTHALQHLVDEKILPDQPLEPLADVIAGAIMQACLAIGSAEDADQARATYEASVMELLVRLASVQLPT
jgi:AcrR family transcriptional regulator